MINHFRQHIPNFVSGVEPFCAAFETTEELLNIPVVAAFKEYEGFSHFAMSEEHLMAIYSEGSSWWVVGSIEKPEYVELPQWEGCRCPAQDEVDKYLESLEEKK